ncbi:DUF2381 family protein [Stigmatella sp. ncwal1]|uniref:DUF2381 family protein n=1 Tax=Stigmatella ashevillensis TaxID=2995309 RepID=A0ABT5DJ71_9BACT|nr:DUF2381 family protein [Stigmatella ashevillena]MDC0712411.1 DUF2381 family protein [Stigmatella ashevillena]
MVLPTPWLPLTLCLLVAGTAAAQAPVRQRQDRRASLPTTDSEPVPELYVATGNLTTVAFNGPLDRASLVVDRTRFKWVDVGDRLLTLEPFTDLGPGERLILQVGFRDKALPTKAILAVLSKADVMDGKLEVDRRANTPEALLAALTQKEAELEELKARSAGSGPASLVLSKWLTKTTTPVVLTVSLETAEASGMEITESIGYEGTFSTLVAIGLRNLHAKLVWTLGQARFTGPQGASAKVLSAQMKPVQLAPGEEGLLVVEVVAPKWEVGKVFAVELVDASGQRRLSFNLSTK